jgi:hypothetical protein
MTLSQLPAAVAAYVEAKNALDLDRLVSTFDENAVVNDSRREFRGKAAIRAWAARNIAADRVTMRVVDSVSRGDAVALAAEVDGDFDKTGLPDPLVLSFYFSTSHDRIDQLVIVLNKPAD